MKRLLVLFLLLSVFLNAQNLQKDWAKIAELEKKNQPKIVLKEIENIYQKSKQENNETELIKALLYKIKYQYLIDKDLSKDIKEIENEIKRTPKNSTKLILKSILAQLYSVFLEQHRDNLQNIPYMDDENNKNIYTWTVKRINSKIKELYMKSLSDEAKQIPIKEYQDILTPNQNNSNLRPTLYDFLAFRALDYFGRDDIDSEYFSINQKEAFGSVNSFIADKFEKLNKKSSKYQALLIYQKLLSFHKKDKDNRVLSYINLKRLKFVYQYFNPKNRDRYYLSALKSLDSQHIDSQALYLAEYYFDKSEYKKAISYARKGIKSNDKYISQKSQNIKKRIEEKHLVVATEPTSMPFENILTKISYKNIQDIYIKVIKLTPKEQNRLYSLKIKDKKQYISSLKSFNEFNISLPKTDDYKNHSTEISLGKYDLGSYIFMISADKLFEKNMVYQNINISKIAYFSKNSEILIVDRDSGEPIDQAKVLFFDKRESNKPITILKSDKNGLVEVPKILNEYYIEIENGKDILNLKNTTRYYKKVEEKKEKTEEKIYFFTDKTIYNHSQDIKFKALIIKKFSDKKPQILPKKKVEVILYSGKRKLESKIFKSDEFGAFYGSFHIPEDGIENELTLYSKFGIKNIYIAKPKKSKTNIDIENKNHTRIAKKHHIDILIDRELNKNSAKIVHIVSQDAKGKYIDIRGKIVIEKYLLEKKIYRKRYWEEVDKPFYSADEFKKLFPDYRYTNQERKKEILKTVKFDTKKSKDILLDNLEQGEYLITLSTRDKSGKKIEKSIDIIVYDITDKKPPYLTYLWQKSDKKSYKVGSTATIYIKSSLPHTKALFHLSRDGKTLQEEWLDINGSAQKEIHITKDDRGDIFYTITMVKNGRDYTQRGTIKVPWDNRLKVEYISFRDKLKPNSKEQWKIKIDTKDEAQMVATLYDSSLDSIIPNSFNIKKLYPKHYIKFYNQWLSNDFHAKHQEIMWDYITNNIQRNFYHLNWDFIKTISIKKRYGKKPEIIKNSKETIFFKPNLTTDKDGDIVIDFKTNEDMTKWNFLGFIHTKDLKIATTKKSIITKKELILKTDTPKFFRENDRITISQKIINMSSRDLNGSSHLELINPINNQKIYPDKNLTKEFKVKKNSSVTLNFEIQIPTINKTKAIKYIATIKTNEYSDIEQNIVPILSNREFITKNQAIYLNPKEKKSFELKLNQDRMKRYDLTIEFSSNPAWYALKAMPCVMEYPAVSNMDVFDKYFVNAMAIKLLRVSPKIEQILKEWREKKEDEERNLGLLFDIDKLKKDKKRAYDKLIKQQFKHYDGGWSWFDGGKSDWYITQSIVEGFAKLKQIGIDKTKTEAMGVATAFMDKQIAKEYQKLQQKAKKGELKLEDDNLNSITIHYLYTRSFYDFPILSKEAYSYYLNQAKKYWKNKNLYEQAIIAIALNKNLGKKEAIEIIKSLKEKAIIDKDGLYFDYPDGYSWNLSPIKAHTTIMYLFDTIAKDKKTVELMKRWLIKNKKANCWQTTNQTADAIYALLFDNAWILNTNKPVDINIPNIEYKPIIEKAKQNYQKGIGYIKISLKGVDKKIGYIEVNNPNSNPIWGNVYWQYFKDINETQNIKNSPFTITKKLSVIKESKIEKKIIPIEKTSIRVGDKIKVEIKLKLNQDMEQIIIKNSIASTFNPIEQESEYISKNGLEYFQRETDSAIYLFFDRLSKGEYLFEYILEVKHQGEFSSGRASIKSNYLPDNVEYSDIYKIKVE